MREKLISTVIVLTFSLLLVFLFLLNGEGHLIGSDSNLDFIAGPVLVPLYGLYAIPAFAIQAIFAFVVFWVLVHQALIKSGWWRALLFIGAAISWLSSGVYTLALAYG